MRIIQKGITAKDRVGTGKCPYCGCQIEATEAECTNHPGYDQREGPYYDYPCPTDGCNKRITVYNFKAKSDSWQPTRD